MTDRPRRPARRLVIDWALVEQRRVAAGMTHTELADRVGAGAVTGPARLWTDNDHDTVALDLLERLCQVLDLHPIELFRAPTRKAHRREQPEHAEPEDIAVIAAALATVTCPPGRAPAAVSSARLAEALGWTLARLADALDALAAQLDDTGLRIDHDPAATSPAPGRWLRARDRHLTATQRVALHRLHTTPNRAWTSRALVCCTPSPTTRGPSPSGTWPTTRPRSSPCNNADSSAATPGAATSNSPRTPTTASPQTLPRRRRSRSHFAGARTLI